MNTIIHKLIKNFIPLYKNNDFNSYDLDKNLKKYIYNNIILSAFVFTINHYFPLEILLTYKNLNLTLMNVLTLPLTIVAGLGVGMCIEGLISKIEEKFYSI